MHWNLRRWAWLLLLLASPAAAQSFPPFSGLVVDAADVLPPATEADLTAKLEALQKDTHRQLVVATIADMGGYELAEYGNKLIRAWGVGLKDANNGAILFIAPNEPKGHRGPRIEVGYGLEPVLTDAFASTVINDQMMPRLVAGDLPGAMTAGTDALVTQLRATPEEAKARVDADAAAFDRTHQRGTTRSGGRSGGGIPVGLIFWGIVFLFVILPMMRGRRGGGGRRWSGGGGSNLPIILWGLGNALGSGRDRGGWDGGGGSSGWGGGGGGGSDGSWGGGGFTGGGGGSGGGGGASGSW